MSKTDAYRLFRAFHDREPNADEIVSVDMADKEDALVVGELYGISYMVKGEKTPYFHQFPSRNRPILLISSDGSQAYILMGGYEFTDRGFEG